MLSELTLVNFCEQCYFRDPYIKVGSHDVDLHIKRFDLDEMVLCIQGSKSFKDWLINLNISNTPEGRHRGWSDAFYYLRPYLDNLLSRSGGVKRFYCIGHSSGGVISQFVTNYFTSLGESSFCRTYGSPNLGRGFPIDILSYENILDPIIYLPLSQEDEVRDKVKFTKLAFNPHSIRVYREYVKNNT